MLYKDFCNQLTEACSNTIICGYVDEQELRVQSFILYRMPFREDIDTEKHFGAGYFYKLKLDFDGTWVHFGDLLNNDTIKAQPLKVTYRYSDKIPADATVEQALKFILKKDTQARKKKYKEELLEIKRRLDMINDLIADCDKDLKKCA